MIVYNISIKISPEIEKEWIQWQREEHIPDILKTGLFSDFKFYRLLEQDQEEGVTFVVQYFSPSVANYNRYIEEFAPLFRQKTFERWGDKFIAFRTVMEVVQ
ncbi:MAG TPA: DUF4286 family protein [Chitinophagaceae bacterium]|nr:DUF4286 family protein [Chitinophagaceae bacterium]